MVVMASSLAVMPVAHTFWPVIVTACLLGFGNGIGSGMVMTLGADFSPDVGRAAFLGVWRQLGDTGATFGPLALSGVTAAVGLPGAVALSAVPGFTAAVMLAYWPARLTRKGWVGGPRPSSDV